MNFSKSSITLSPVITVDDKKCVNCHKCIAVCPIKYCNDGSGTTVRVINDMCIGCGACIKACSHDARNYVDDTSEFIRALKKNAKLVAIVAPAIASNFPGQYLKINTLLRELGVAAVFDVSFGAELTVKSYLNFIEKHDPQTVISQPCPAIVTYIQIYHPELIRYLAPADSPMAHTMKMIRKYFPEYSDHKIVAISPCIAKKREFDELGIGDYNITIESLKRLIDYNNIDLSGFPDSEFDNPPAERAVLFSTPGGLLRTAEREHPAIIKNARKIEGRDNIYPYLEKLHQQIKNGFTPKLIDCLNCQNGCNGGPGTLNEEKHPDEIEFYVEKRNEEAREKIQSPDDYDKSLDPFWEENLYIRKYKDLSLNNQINIPSPAKLQEIYIEMQKIKKEDFFNCAFCGYNTCERMAIAIYNGLNRKENCYHFKSKVINTLAANVKETSDKLHSQDEKINMVLKKNYNEILILKNEFANLLTTVNSNSDKLNEFDSIVQTISKLTSLTNLLSINASIEASHAGEAGNGFSVVAREMKQLAESSGKESDKIKPYLKGMTDLFNEIKIKINNASTQFESSTMLSKEAAESLEIISSMIDELNQKADEFTEETISVLRN